MGNPELGVGLDQGLVQHLLLFIIHIGDQKGEENHQLLDLFCQHGVDVVVIQFVDQFHFRCECRTNLHDVDAGAGTRGQFDIGTANFVAGTLELMAFERSNNIALDAAHPKPSPAW